MPQQNQVCILNSKHNMIHTFGTGITIDKDGFIYVCSFNNFQIYKINININISATVQGLAGQYLLVISIILLLFMVCS